MTADLIISARSMGHFEGGSVPQEINRYQVCPGCGRMMSPDAHMCVVCRGVRCSERVTGTQESKMDNHHRFDAALGAGWTEALLLAALPYTLPTWEEIAERCPEAVMQYHPELVVRKWWDKGRTDPTLSP